MAGSLYATIKPRPIEDITIDGRPYRIPAHPAVIWLDALTGPTASTDIIPGLLEPDSHTVPAQEWLEIALIGDAFTVADYAALYDEVMDIAAARPRWTTERIISIAADEVWGDYIRGQIVLHHLDATKVSLAAWLDGVYALLTTGLSMEKRQQFDIQLAAPPPGAKMSQEARRRNRAAFDAIRDQ